MQNSVQYECHADKTTHILHVEDNRVDSIIMHKILEHNEKYQFEFSDAGSLKSALDALAYNKFDLLLLDLTLPDSSGVKTLKSIQQRYSEIPIIVLTGSDDDKMATEAIRCGAQDYIVKGDLKPDVITRIIFSAIDRKTAEQALKESEQRLNYVLEGSSDGFWDWNIQTGVLYFSPRFESMLGYSTGSLKQHMGTWQKMVHPDDIDIMLNDLNDHLQGETELYQTEHRIKTKSGEWIWASGRGKVVEWNAEHHPSRMVGAYTDITHKKEAEEKTAQMRLQLQQASKLESIGRLAAGIAHEINTPAQFVGDNIWFLKDECSNLLPLIKKTIDLIKTQDETENHLDSLKAIQTAWQEIDFDYISSEIPMAITQSLEGIERISSIVKAMKAFSHPGSDKKELTNINKAIENTSIVCRNEWKLSADLITKYCDTLPPIECHPGELNQAFLNIIVNAAHSIQDKIDTGKCEHGKITISTTYEDNYAIIKFQDTGTGIPENLLKNIFDPFFTTKAVGKGTGQGLATAHSVIVDKHQGQLNVESVHGKGSTFTVKLPINTDTDDKEQTDKKENNEKISTIR